MASYEAVKQAHEATFAQLEELGVCPSCRIRAVSSNCSAFAAEDILGCARDCLAKKSQQEAICCVCLGLLQPSLSIFQHIVSTLTVKCGHEPTPAGYRLSISLPTSSFIRQSLLEAKLPVAFVLETKDVIRSAVAEALRKDPKWRHVPLSPTGVLNVKIILSHPSAANEESHFASYFPETPAQRKQKRKRRSRAGRSIKELTAMLQKGYPSSGLDADFPPKCPKESCAIDEISVVRDPVFFTGNYIKMSREMSQTPWVINGVRKGTISVEENIAPHLKEILKGDTAKFHAAGREDVDVRMLGDGRPFVVQVLNCKRSVPSEEEVALLQKNFSEGSVWVKELRFTTDASCMERLKEWEMSKRKKYVCVVWLSKAVRSQEDLAPLNRTTDMQVLQKTPLRVLHRRSLLERHKIIHSCSTEILNPHFILLRLCSSAGTYIKEFVHGDRGRTTPNVGSLLGK